MHLTIALAALGLGLSYYLLFRPEDSTYGIPWHAGNLPPLTFSNSLPSFLHGLAFMLLGCFVIGQKIRYSLSWIAFWLIIELAFEVVQHSSVASLLTSARVPRIIMLYARGSFDIYDVLATLAAAVIALFTVCERGAHEKGL